MEECALDLATFNQLAAESYLNEPAGDAARTWLYTISSRPDSWIAAQSLLSQADSLETQFVLLTIISEGIRLYFNDLPGEQKDYLKNYYFDYVFQVVDCNPAVIRQADNVLLEIVKHEWPGNWPNFLKDLVTSASSSRSADINAIYFLGILSNEIVHGDFTSDRQQELMSTLQGQFQYIYTFLESEFYANEDVQLRTEILKSFSYYLEWIHLKQMSISNLIPLFEFPEYRFCVLECLASIVYRKSSLADQEMKTIFHEVIQEISKYHEILTDPDLNQLLVHVLAGFVLLDQCALMPCPLVLSWMLNLTYSSEGEVLAECMEMWHQLTKNFTFDITSFPFSADTVIPLQIVLCEKMVKPSEKLFETMKETLYFTAKIEKSQILSFIIEKIGSETESLPYLYSVAAVSGVSDPQEETEFVEKVFAIVLPYEDMERNEAILYIIRQYHHVLNNNWPLLSSSIDKIMQLIDTDLQHTTIETLLYITKRCYQPLLTVHPQESHSFARELLSRLPTYTETVIDQNLPSLFESMASLIRNSHVETEKRLMVKELFNIPITHVSIEIMTKVLPILDDSTFQPHVETVMNTAIGTFIQDPNEQMKSSLIQLFESFFSVFPRSQLVPQIITMILNEYANSFLSTTIEAITTLIVILKTDVVDFIPEILRVIVDPTSEMLQANPNEYPDHSLALFNLLAILLTKVYSSPQYYNTETFTNLLDIIIFGLHHQQLSICEVSLSCISSLITEFDDCEDISMKTDFYSRFFLQIISEFIEVLMDGYHQALFNHITMVLFHMLQLIITERVTLFDMDYVVTLMAEKLCEIYPTIKQDEILLLCYSISNVSTNCGQLRQQMHDFIISAKRAIITQNQVCSTNTFDEEIQEIELYHAINSPSEHELIADADLTEY